LVKSAEGKKSCTIEKEYISGENSSAGGTYVRGLSAKHGGSGAKEHLKHEQIDRGGGDRIAGRQPRLC